MFSLSKYLKRHNVIFNGRIEDRANCALVGTGIIGAAVWQENDSLILQITNVNASPQSQMSSGTVIIRSDLTGNSKTVLDLYTGTLTISYDDVTFTVYGGGDERLLIKADDRRENPKTSVELCGWDSSYVQDNDWTHGRYVKSPSDWLDFHFKNTDGKLTLTRGSNSWYGIRGVSPYESIEDETAFGYSIGVTADGTDFVSENNKITFNSNEYSIKIYNPSRFTNKDTPEECLKVLDRPFDDLKEQSEKFWADFWEQTYVIDHNPASDYIENLYYLAKYILACGMYGKYPFHFITGVFRNNGDNGLEGDIGDKRIIGNKLRNTLRWSVAYWWYNQRNIYGWQNSSGCSNILKAQLDLYLDNIQMIRSETRKKYPDTEGIVVPEIISWNGERGFSDFPGSIASHINCSGGEIALLAYDYAKFTNDVEYLNEKFLPFACELLDFTISHELFKNEKGVYEARAGVSNARESYLKIGNSITTLGYLKALLPKVIEVMEENGKDPSKYKDVLENLVPFKFGGFPKRFLSGDGSLDYKRTNWDDPSLEIVYPFGICGCGKPYYNEAVNNYMNRIGRNEIIKMISWDYAPIWAARLGLSDNAMEEIRNLIAISQKFSNGITSDGNSMYEPLGNLITALNECMLQSYDGIIRVFPAVYQGDKGGTARFKLKATDGFTVESEYNFNKFQAEYVIINSEFGKKCRFFNPYGEGRKAAVRSGENEFVTSDEIIEFETEPGKSYLIHFDGSEPVYGEPEYKENNAPKEFRHLGITRQIGT